MAYPENWYRDPSNAADDPAWERLKMFEIREKHGCKRCAKQMHFGKHEYCSIGKRPGYRGFCPEWELKG